MFLRPAVDLIAAIKNRELSSLELTESLIERINKINPKINAYCTPTFESALDEAKRADDKVKKGETLGLLNGLPLSVKDEFLLKGVRTTFGSKIFENYIPEEDTSAITRLKDADCVILGKTNMPEFGYMSITYNKIFGVTRNPWNLNRIPGGSSGGAAAAVASGISPIALGSDGGGSIRIPSALCGVYGFKPSFGRVPAYPLMGLVSEMQIAHYGPIVRYVQDAALMLDAIKGPDDADKFSLPSFAPSFLEGIKQKPKKLTIGYSLDLGYVKAVDPEVEKAILISVDKFEKLGWNVKKAEIKMRKPELCFYTLYTSMYGYNFRPFLKEWRDKMDPDFLKMIDASLTYSGLDIMRALQHRKEIYNTYYEYFKNFDVLITPTTAVPAFEIGKLFPSIIGGKSVSPSGWVPFAFIFNLTGHPAASIPCGWSSEGLPIGMQIVGRRHDDLTVLQTSKAFEELAPWQDKMPPIA